MVHTVYKTTNNVNGKIYIGVHSTENANDSYLGSGTLLAHAFRKYGRENFTKEILYIFDSPKEAYEMEATLVTEDFISSGNTYNYTLGGGGSGPGPLSNVFGKRWKLSTASRENIRNAKLGEKNPMFGGLEQSHKDKLKIVMKEKARRGANHPNFGKTLSLAEKEKLRISSRMAYANRPLGKCQHCGAEMKPNLLARYHGDKCKTIKHND